MPGDYITPDEYEAFVVEQSAFPTLVHPGAANAFQFNKATITPKEERKEATGDRGTLSRGKTIRLRRSADVSLSGNFIPSGVLGVAPDIGLFLKHIYGIETIVGGTSVKYSFAKHPESTLFGLSVHFMANFEAISAVGFVPQSLKIDAPGEAEATFELSGEARDVIQTGESTLASQAMNGTSVVSVQPGDGANFEVGSKIDIGTHTGSVVTLVAGDSVSFTPGVGATQSAGAVVKPTLVTGTTQGDEISGCTGSFLLNGAAVPSISHSVTLEANRTMRNNNFGSSVATGFYSAKKRALTFENQLYHMKPSFKYIQGARNLTQYDYQMIVGEVAGKRAKWDMNKVEFDILPMETTEEDEAIMNVNGYAVRTGVEDEGTLIFD